MRWINIELDPIRGKKGVFCPRFHFGRAGGDAIE
jgi:hypothetical protein